MSIVTLAGMIDDASASGQGRSIDRATLVIETGPIQKAQITFLGRLLAPGGSDGYLADIRLLFSTKTGSDEACNQPIVSSLRFRRTKPPKPMLLTVDPNPCMSRGRVKPHLRQRVPTIPTYCRALRKGRNGETGITRFPFPVSTLFREGLPTVGIILKPVFPEASNQSGRLPTGHV